MEYWTVLFYVLGSASSNRQARSCMQLEWLQYRNSAICFIVIDYTFLYEFRSIAISLTLLAGGHINVSFTLSQSFGVI
jgi:hypothetical protein